MVIEQERVTWLACYGVQLNLWNNITFQKIGQLWGEIVGMDDDTVRMQSLHCGKVRIATSCKESINTTINLNCKGVSYLVKVCEKQVVISKVVYKQCKCCNLHSNGDNHSSYGNTIHQASEVESKQEKSGAEVEGWVEGELDKEIDVEARESEVRHDEQKDMERHDRWLSTSEVQETNNNMERINFRGAWVEKPTAAVLSSMHFQTEGNQNIVHEIATPGYMRSISGSEINRPGFNIEVILNKAHVLKGGTMMGQRASEIN
ncbi:hypothetical protein CsSME_00025266 [Camellia sinensis var. sinensis]